MRCARGSAREGAGRRAGARGLALAALLSFAAACAGIEVVGPSDGGGSGGRPPGSGTATGGGSAIGGGGTAPSTSSILVGRWTRAILLVDDGGALHESRTTWEFRPDGSAIRTVTAWNVSSGAYDTLVSVAQWRTSGSTLTITYLAPTTGTATFAWRVDGTTLTIGGAEFTRLP